VTQQDMLTWLEANTNKKHGNFINGEWVQGEKHFPVYHTARNKQLLGHFTDSDEGDVNKAVEAAHTAFKQWSKQPAPDRSMILLKFADLLERDAEELAFMLSAEQGKALAESRGEVGRAAKEARFAAGEALRIQGETMPGERGNVWNATQRHPIGVVAAIAPWNFPVVTPVRKIAPALAYGCTVVFKPASVTPWATIKLFELLDEAGVPKGVVNLVTGSGSRVGNPLVSHPLVKGISFTGSTQQGIKINEIAARRLARTQLELGGKNPAVVLNYSDLEFAAKQIVSAAFACSGQRCTAISRVIVLKDQAKALTEALLKETKALKVGPSWGTGVTMGPLVNQEHLDSVQSYIQTGKAEGAVLLCGGEILTEGEYEQGSYMMPAIFDQVTPDMKIAKEEIFGPVLSVIAVDTEQEAFDAANSVEYGLAASIFTDHLSSAFQFAEQIQSGMVHINHGTASAAHMPFGGVKNSGFGAYSIGSSNKEFFTETKVVYVQY
jgi:acyl-CoA reductase-like NAD-dependent aldehyde dehydrogenase